MSHTNLALASCHVSHRVLAWSVAIDVTYALSVIISAASPEGGGRAAIADAAPFLAGSLGTLLFDFIIFFQVIWFQLSRSRSQAMLNNTLTAEAGLQHERGVHMLYSD